MSRNAIRAVAVVAGCGIAAVGVGGVALHMRSQAGIQNVTLHVAAGATIHDNPGGVGPVSAVQDFQVVLDPTLYRGRIQVTGVSVIPGAHVAKGQAVLSLDAVALQVNADVVSQQLAATQAQIAAAQQSQNSGAGDAAALGGISQQISAIQNSLANDARNIAHLEAELAAPLPTPAPAGSPTIGEIQAIQQGFANALANARTQQLRDQASLAAAQGSYSATSARAGAANYGGNQSVGVLQAKAAIDQQLLDIAKGAPASLSAPIDGDVTAVNISAGQAATPGVPLVEILDASKLRVTARFPISEQQYVTVGAPAHLTFGAVPGSSLTGKVVSVVPVTADGLTFQAIIDADNGATSHILPGLVANVSVEAAHAVPVSVPRICVLNLDQDPQAFVVDSANVAHLRTLHIGLADADNVEVVSGINAGDRCVVAGNQTLTDGAAVRVDKVEG